MMERSGGWRCLDCAHMSAAVPDPESPPTCGQREVMYCSLCNAIKCHEFTLTNTPPPPRRMQMPVASGFNPTPHQLERMACDGRPSHQSVRSVEEAPAVLSGGTALSSSSTAATMGDGSCFPDPSTFSELTVDSLQELQKRVANYADAIVKELGERKLCIVCYSAPKEVIFYPCKHKCLCRQCGEKVSQCPVCRVSIVDRILPYDA